MNEIISLIISYITTQLSNTCAGVPEPSWPQSMTIKSCDTGSWAPQTTYDTFYHDKMNCDLTCEQGCSVGYGVYDKERLVCFLQKFRANFHFKDGKCRCGIYIKEEFYNCERVNPGYMRKEPVLDPECIQDSCEDHCDWIEAYVSKKRGIPRLVYCAERKMKLDTYELTGECILRKEEKHIFCGCGVRLPLEYAPKNRNILVDYFHGGNWVNEETNEFGDGETNWTDTNPDKDLMRDLRRHDLRFHLPEPTFKYLVLDPILSANYKKKDEKVPFLSSDLPKPIPRDKINLPPDADTMTGNRVCRTPSETRRARSSSPKHRDRSNVTEGVTPNKHCAKENPKAGSVAPSRHGSPRKTVSGKQLPTVENGVQPSRHGSPRKTVSGKQLPTVENGVQPSRHGSPPRKSTGSQQLPTINGAQPIRNGPLRRSFSSKQLPTMEIGSTSQRRIRPLEECDLNTKQPIQQILIPTEKRSIQKRKGFPKKDVSMTSGIRMTITADLFLMEINNQNAEHSEVPVQRRRPNIPFNILSMLSIYVVLIIFKLLTT